MEAQRQQLESNREAAIERACCWVALLLLVLLLFLALYRGLLGGYSVTVHVASLSLSLSSVPLRSPSVVSGNWSVALSVRNGMRRRRIVWDHPQVMLFYGHEFVAGTFLERFSVAPRGEGTLEMGMAAFSRDVREWTASAMGAAGREDGGAMELQVSLIYHDDRTSMWVGGDNFNCRGLKVGFSSQNQSQVVGLLLSGPPKKCT